MTKPIALQMYTLRHACEADLQSTLARVAELGFDAVELAGLNGHCAEAVRSWLDDVGLWACSAHVSIDDLDADIGAQIGAAETLGYSRLVMPWTTARTAYETTDLIRRLNAAQEALAVAGLALGYHNHEFELERWDSGGCMLDRIIAETDLFLEPDLGWLWYAERPPAAFLAAHAGRCPLVHVKDLRSRTGREFCRVGDGGVGYGELIPRLCTSGTEVLIVEQDECNGLDPFEECRGSLAFVQGAVARAMERA